MIPSGFAVRPARPADAPALVALIREYEEQYGAATFGAADLLEEWAGAGRLFASQRFGFVRRYARMQIELAERPLPAPEPPLGVVLRARQPGEERAFYAVTDAAFRGCWGYAALGFEGWLERAQSQQVYVEDLWIVAEEQRRHVGVARCLPERCGGGWVRSLAVHPDARGRGIGLALLQEAFRVFQARGERIVGLGVDTENATGALALYERAGMAVEESSDVWERLPAMSAVAIA